VLIEHLLCRRSSILIFCKEIFNEHKSATCSHDAQEALSTWLRTTDVVHAFTHTVIHLFMPVSIHVSLFTRLNVQL
jgi:hypothetical protein